MTIKAGIILGTTRPNRNGEAVARWVRDLAAKRGDAEYELIDLRDYALPHLDEPNIPALGGYRHEHTRRWSEKISSLDAFVFVTPEYNHSIPGVLKDAIDFLYTEWNNKVAGFVGYGGDGAVRAVEHLRHILATAGVATVTAQVALSIHTDFENMSAFRPAAAHEERLGLVLDQVLAWAGALRTLRA
ncbi:NAD(P)H-dependent FMN reductase [Thermocatellispora tengchongensis]|uniref:NAD(P)H-dependent FMN reductase n=1 Tax=Thermocatellispora tengchongensis TaxID=1073253 RepID=A0A840P1W5_9ACTN|nr:NAD(P)H-dependent oxidoreductase [Thermocatellispora tengchongensis]MBB5133352.1 NAD(P)H-dependent FMN reductase [Thermocatellispora tengchongensis]